MCERPCEAGIHCGGGGGGVEYLPRDPSAPLTPQVQTGRRPVPAALGLVAVLLSTGCGAHSPAQPAAKVQIESQSSTVQLPPLFVGDQPALEHRIVVRNQYSQPVRFTQIRQSCSCSTATKLATMRLAPGEETTLHFHADLRSRVGPQRFVCHLVEEGGAEWTYALETTLHERARFIPVGPLHFGMVNPRAETVRDLEFRLHAESQDALPGSVTVRTDGDALRVEAGESVVEEQPDGTWVRQFAIQVRLRAPEAPGLGQQPIYAQFERNGFQEQAQMAVTWNVRSYYEVRPPQVYFGTLDPSSAKPVERRLSIRRTDGRPLAIKAVRYSCPAVQHTVEKASDPVTASLTLVLDPALVTGSFWEEMRIDTDLSEQPTIKIPIAAIIRVSR